LDPIPNSDPKHHVSDIASPGPIDPSSGQPDHHAEVSALKVWLRQNAVSLAVSAAVVALVCVYLDPIDTLKVVIGLGFIIFIHELGHFLAAKWCDVHVKTFSIGFGPAVPFCSYKWGETTYMVGVIPLGGYVSMVGEGTGESTPDGDPDDDDTDPRSFKNKGVGQRMLIISAGVIMNVILGMLCFMAAYLHGVREKPATVGTVETGSAAWQGGIRTDADIKKIGNRNDPFFDDIRPIVMSTDKGEQVPVVVEQPGPDGKRVVQTLTVEPLRAEGVLYPQLGVASPYRLTLVRTKKRSIPPVVPGTPAARAKDPGFEPGDRIVGMTDPADPAKVTPLPPDRREPASGNPDFDEYYRRMVLLAEKPITFHVLRAGQPAGAAPTAITVQPAFHSDLGVRMQMGKVGAVRRGGPADGKVVPVPLEGSPTEGDTIKAVKLPPGPDGRETWFVNGTVDFAKPEFQTADRAKVDVKPLDPVRLPFEMTRWADGKPASWNVRLVVLRKQGHKEDEPVELALTYDPSFRFDREVVSNPNSPLPVSGLGLAYRVDAVVAADPAEGTPAAKAKLKANDVITAVRLKSLDANGNKDDGEWKEIQTHQWAQIEELFQLVPPHEIDLRIKRGDETPEVTLVGVPDKEWGLPNRGLYFDFDFRTQQAADVGDAITLGAYRTVRFIKVVYQNLYSMVRGRVSPKTMSGPLTIATVSYRIAGEDFWQFLLFLGMISVNLAVVNFLPIPVLDGGHMVFLIIEKVLGRPVPERLFAATMWLGLFMILCLFVFVIGLDIQRLFF
jgi:regulator of sigma E protease